MPRRWMWSVLDLVALICLGQATMLAQREAAGPPPRLDPVLELSRAQAGADRGGARIYEAGGTVVVALPLSGGAAAPDVTVDSGRIRLSAAAGAGAQDIPVPATADPSRYSVRAAGGELRVIFAKAGEEAGS